MNDARLRGLRTVTAPLPVQGCGSGGRGKQQALQGRTDPHTHSMYAHQVCADSTGGVLTHRSPDSLGVSGSPPTPRGLHCPTWELHIPVCRPSLPQSDPGWALRPAQTRRPPLGTPSTILIGALPTVGEDRTVRAQPLTLRAKQRRLREVRSELALHNQEADSSHGSSVQITPGSVLSSRTSRHPPQQAARPGATQPCLWPAGESGAEAPF
uniref:Uncharacterized protein n=1 Tax=Rangifer tarandus platyrhynchus TaxID=3082113 RepID=A0ACB0F630_RANTA|nr:unnamed protein product [Rangifer tarandus platyrhynchus]